MKTIQMTLDDNLVASVDKLVEKLHTTKSAFTRATLRNAIRNFNVSRLEKKHRMGYETRPVGKKEFSLWEEEQDWGEK